MVDVIFVPPDSSGREARREALLAVRAHLVEEDATVGVNLEARLATAAVALAVAPAAAAVTVTRWRR
jgi:hypothetical protein